jgi:hypothetical protein
MKKLIKRRVFNIKKMSEIPIENLPNYFREYSVSIYSDMEEEPIGSILYTTIGLLPTKESETDILSINLTGFVPSNLQKFEVIYDLKTVAHLSKNFKYQNKLGGTFVICGKVLDASRHLKYIYDEATNKLSILIEIDFLIKKESVVDLRVFNITISLHPEIEIA